jgi:hypothetical protein
MFGTLACGATSSRATRVNISRWQRSSDGRPSVTRQALLTCRLAAGGHSSTAPSQAVHTCGRMCPGSYRHHGVSHYGAPGGHLRWARSG